MVKSEKFGEKEAIWIFIILFVSKIFFSNIYSHIYSSGTAAHIQTLYCGLIALALFFVLTFLYKSFEGKDLFDLTYYSFGKIGLIVAGASITGMLLIHTSLGMKVYSEAIATIILTSSPVYYIIMFIAITILASAFSGLGTLSKFCYIAGTIIVILLMALFALDIGQFDMSNIYPILGNGYKSILTGLGGVGLYSEIMYIFVLIPFLQKDVSYKKVGYSALIFSILVIFIATMVYIFTIPYPMSMSFKLPILQISGSITVSAFFQRAEAFFLVLWIFSAFLSLGTLFYFMTYIFSKTFGLKNRRPVIGGFLVLVVFLARLYQNFSDYSAIYLMFYDAFTWVSFAFPAFIFICCKIKKIIYKTEVKSI